MLQSRSGVGFTQISPCCPPDLKGILKLPFLPGRYLTIPETLGQDLG